MINKIAMSPRQHSVASAIVGRVIIGITGGTVTVVFSHGGYPYNDTTQLSAPITAGVWHSLNVSYALEQSGRELCGTNAWPISYILCGI